MHELLLEVEIFTDFNSSRHIIQPKSCLNSSIEGYQLLHTTYNFKIPFAKDATAF